MQASTSGRTSPVAGVLVLVGGALAAVGCRLDWFKFRADLTSVGGGVSERALKGPDLSDGKIFIWVAVALVVIGVVMLLLRQRGARITLSVLSFLGAAFVGGFGLYDALTPKAPVIDEAAKQLSGAGVERARQFLENLFDQGILKITVQIGLWLVVAGGAVALVGALAGLFSRSKVHVARVSTPVGLGEPSTPVGSSPRTSGEPVTSVQPPEPDKPSR